MREKDDTDLSVEDDDNDKNIVPLTIINTNARSLCPKISSLIDCFTDLRASVGIITETWFSDGEALERDIENLSMGAGLAMICRNRPANNRGFSHGGVAVVYRESAIKMTNIRLHNPGEYEVLCCTGILRGSGKRLVEVACYIPPNYTVQRGRGCMEFITGVTMEMKRRYDDPMLLLAGDFNQWKVEGHLMDFPDIQEHDVGETRGSHRIDRIFSNFHGLVEAGTVPPLELSLIHI